MKKQLTIGFAQYAIRALHPLENIRKLSLHIRKLLPASPGLIMLPEIFLGAPSKKKEMHDYGLIYNEFLAELSVTAARNATAFYGSIIEENAGVFHNTAVFITPTGKIRHVYRKNHMFRFENEHKTFMAGLSGTSFVSPWGKIAPQICYDIRFPELLRKMVFQGATMAFVCAQWPDTRRDHWLTLLKSRAIENQIFIIACNRTGEKNGLRYNGHSCAISPWGEFLYLLKGTGQSGTHTINTDLVHSVRRQFPFLRDAIRGRIVF